MTILTMKRFKDYVERAIEKKMRQRSNIMEATSLTTGVRKVAGAAVLVQQVSDQDRVLTKFSLVGLFFYIFWNSIFVYCVYESIVNDETILRKLFKTKLGHYGDLIEQLIATVFVFYSMWKIPFDISGSTLHIQVIVDIDNALADMNVDIDYNKTSRVACLIAMCQVVALFVHLFSLWICQMNLGVRMPYELMYLVVTVNATTLLLSTHYCFYLYILKERFRMINDKLNEVRDSVFIGSQKSILVQNRQSCEVLRGCARVYASLCRGVGAADKMFGKALVLVMFCCICYIVLNMFYLMEACAAAMFKKDLERFIYFCIYIFWQVLYAAGIIILNIFFCEATVKQARSLSHSTHEIINANVSASVSSVAMQLSQQLLHQAPTFSASGLYKLEYNLLLQGARSVTTFLVILLQFALEHQEGPSRKRGHQMG